MKIAMLPLLVALSCCSAGAADKPALDNRIRKLTAKFEAMQGNSDKRIPAESLRKAQGIVLLDRTKAGFISPIKAAAGWRWRETANRATGDQPLFLGQRGQSRFQIGGQQSFLVILLMDTNALRSFIDGKIEFGGEARGTAGDSSAGAQGEIKPTRPFWSMMSVAACTAARPSRAARFPRTTTRTRLTAANSPR